MSRITQEGGSGKGENPCQKGKRGRKIRSGLPTLLILLHSLSRHFCWHSGSPDFKTAESHPAVLPEPTHPFPANVLAIAPLNWARIRNPVFLGNLLPPPHRFFILKPRIFRGGFEFKLGAHFAKVSYNLPLHQPSPLRIFFSREEPFVRLPSDSFTETCPS